MTRPFRFGVQSYSASSAQDWRDQARWAEDHGFSTFSVADHVIGPGPALSAANHPVQDVAAVPAMAVAIEATSTIRVGARVFCVDYRQPVVFAKEMATLDFFSDGRLELGLGAGWIQSEYEAMGVPWDRAGVRLDRLEETIALLRAHFGDGLVDVSGEHVNASGFEGVPKPANGAPPIMIGGGARRILGIAGREADIVSLNFNNSAGKLGPDGFGSGTAELTEQKIGWIRDGAGDRFERARTRDRRLFHRRHRPARRDARQDGARHGPRTRCARRPPAQPDRVDRLDLRPAGRTTRTLWHLLRDVQRPCRQRRSPPSSNASRAPDQPLALTSTHGMEFTT